MFSDINIYWFTREISNENWPQTLNINDANALDKFHRFYKDKFSSYFPVRKIKVNDKKKP